MPPVDGSQNIIIANTAITLNNTGDLLTALARCVSKFREINHNCDEFTTDLLSHLDAFIATKSAEFFSSPSVIDKINGSQIGNTNNEISSHSNDNEPQEDAANRLHGELDDQTRQDGLSWRTREIVEHRDHELLNEQTEQNIAANHASDASQPPPRPEINTPNANSRELSESENTLVPHDFEDGVVRLRPSKSQWSDFERILQDAKSLAAAGNGICKVIIPGVEMLKAASDSTLSSFSYTARPRENGTVAVEMMPDETVSEPPQPEDTSSLSAPAVSLLERQIQQGLQGVHYCADLKARTESERSRLGLPASPIWPLGGDDPGQTGVRVAGMYSPYAYKTISSFGAAFPMYQEAWNLYTVNYLHKGSKVWIVVSPSAADLFEQKFRESFPVEELSDCAQFIHHSASYVPLETLGHWNVAYKIVRQNAGEAFLTFPRTYCQGFSTGSTLAETVNYADHDWSPNSYAACNPRTCPKELISRLTIDVRETDEEQYSVDEGGPNNREAANVRQISDRMTETTEKQNTRRGPRIKYIKKRRAGKESHESQRKGHKSSHDSAPRRMSSVNVLLQKGASEVLEGVTSRPNIDVGSIYQRFMALQSDSSMSYDDTKILTLMRLFYAIASPDAICQLRDVCQSLRNGPLQMTESTENLFSTVKALDRLDASDHVASITRRFYLVALSAKRFEFQADFSKNSDHSGTRAVQKRSDGVFERNDALALTEMMAEAYPQLKPTRFRNTQGRDEYGKKLKTLKDRLVSGQKWSKLSGPFSSGILALVPTQGEYHVSNTNFEKLSLDAIDILIKMLDEYRGDFLRQVSKSISVYALTFLRGSQYGGKFSFEDTDASLLRTEKYDSPSLIELCRVEKSQPDPIA